MTGNKAVFDKWTLFKVWLLGGFVPNCTTYPRYYGTGFCAALLPALRKLYADRPDELKDAMEVYGQSYYLAEPTTGLAVTAIVLRMEEERAEHGELERSTINNFKLGIMGGLAGFGDTIFTSTLRPLAMAIFTPMAQAGNIMGPLGFMLFKGGCRTANSIFWFLTCYRLGRGALGSLMTKGTGLLHRFMEGTVALAMVVMGAMTASYVKPTVALAWESGSLQAFFDSALPGILPLATVFGIYFLMKKNMSVVKIILIFLAISVAGSVIGLFA